MSASQSLTNVLVTPSLMYRHGSTSVCYRCLTSVHHWEKGNTIASLKRVREGEGGRKGCRGSAQKITSHLSSWKLPHQNESSVVFHTNINTSTNKTKQNKVELNLAQLVKTDKFHKKSDTIDWRISKKEPKMEWETALDQLFIMWVYQWNKTNQRIQIYNNNLHVHANMTNPESSGPDSDAH